MSANQPTLANRETTVFRVNRMALAVPLLMLLPLVILAVPYPWLWPALLIPLVIAAGILKVRTTVSPYGLTTTGLRSTSLIPWEQVRRLGLPTSGRVTVETNYGQSLRLHAVTFNDLGALASASGGRIPSPLPRR